jgi:hypothetical protein
MNERIRELAEQATTIVEMVGPEGYTSSYANFDREKFAELILQDMHRKVIASILITDVVMEEKCQVPTSEDYIRAIHKDFGVEE